MNAVLRGAVDEYRNTQYEEAQLLEVRVEYIIPEPVVEISRQEEDENSSSAEISRQGLEAIEEDHEPETSNRTSRETQGSQSSASSNNTGSDEEYNEVRTSTWPSGTQSSPTSPQNRVVINNTGSGVIVNRNVGNIYNTNVSNVGNNNSVNHHYYR